IFNIRQGRIWSERFCCRNQQSATWYSGGSCSHQSLRSFQTAGCQCFGHSGFTGYLQPTSLTVCSGGFGTSLVGIPGGPNFGSWAAIGVKGPGLAAVCAYDDDASFTQPCSRMYTNQATPVIKRLFLPRPAYQFTVWAFSAGAQW